VASIVAIGAVSPLGIGAEAWSNGPIGMAARTAIARDPILEAAKLRKPFAARVSLPKIEGVDPATQLLSNALAQIEPHVEPGKRIGLAIGTSSGGMASAEKLYDARAANATITTTMAHDATYHAPFVAARARLESLGHRVVRACHPLTACSASTLAIGIGLRWLDFDECDLVIAGGYDALTVFVAAGFEALGATTANPPPRPFRIGRDGMSLGEGAALFVLARSHPSPIAHISGFGASGDGVHLTAPDRTGSGLARSARRALDDACVDPASIDLVSVHGTSTPFNEPMESKAIASALGGDRRIPVHAAKATIGHTLGAAGALETALVVDAIVRGVIPATAGEGELDPEVNASPRTHNEKATIGAVLKLSAAFGGANAALVVTRTETKRTVPARRSVREVARVQVAPQIDLADLSAKSGIARDRLGRMDLTAHLALAAVSALAESVGRDRLVGAGIVLGTALATLDVNDQFADGMRRKGAQFAEGRRFAYTTPNAAAGECAIAFALTGPNLAVGRGPDAAEEARAIGELLVSTGDAHRLVVIDLEPAGIVTTRVAELIGLAAKFGARASLIEAS